jgi:transposase
VDEKVKLTNKITATLKAYYPLALDIFSDLDTLIFCDFVQRWPNLSKLKGARRETLEKFFKSHRCGRVDLINRRIELISTAISLTDDDAIIKPYQRRMLGLVSSLKPMLETIKAYDTEITTVFEQHQDRDIFASFPSAGDILAPRLLAAFGSDRNAFSSADEVNRCVGIAPVVERSGKRPGYIGGSNVLDFYAKRP